MAGSFYKYKFVLTGGGTGGHIMPLIAMSGYLQEYPVELIYIGEKNGREQTIAEQNGVEFVGILSGKYRRYTEFEALVKNLVDVCKITIGIFQSLYILFKFRPNAILSKGGYVSLPVVMAGWVLKIPILIHESDIEMGLTNKISAKFAKCVATGFPVENYKKLEGVKMIYTGTPIDRDFFDASPKDADYEYFGFHKNRPVLLITGGIQGAHEINKMIKEILPELLKNWQVIHLCGEADYSDLSQMRSEMEDLKDRYALFSRLDKERIGAMRIANLVVSRASATTLSELAGMGKPIVLIPLPSAASDHQTKNARVFENEGAAVVLNEKELTSEMLYETIKSLEDDREKLGSMAKALSRFAKPEAGKLLTEQLIQLMHE